jgi:ubiquinone/menaquinone biosynthesis C-methylase UbiE
MNYPNESPTLNVERAVRERYSDAARSREDALCCPIDYDPRLLEVIPREVLERDYGCGDPSVYVTEGDTVLDLGSGAGKICFIAAQLAGPTGRVTGVDMNDDMLQLARKSAPLVAKRVGYANVEFRRGKIQDLALDQERVNRQLAENPVHNVTDMSTFEDFCERLRREEPLIPDDSVDIVVSNCVLNLVHPSEKAQLIREIFRVLKRGGRIAISDIVSDEPVPEELRNDPELWSGCISGAFEEQEILSALEEAGFYGIEIDRWEEEPFATVDGIVFRSVTITAKKGKDGPCYEANQAVIYKGPWRQVEDDDGHVLRRGERSAVCEKTFAILSSDPYAAAIIPVEPIRAVEGEKAPFDCARQHRRDPRETKGASYALTKAPQSDCC